MIGKTESDPRVQKQRYTLNLAEHLSVCELNYQRLMAMLPDLRGGKTHWQWHLDPPAAIRIDIQLLDVAPYTSVLAVDQQAAMPLPSFSIRMCHDAEVAEVIRFNHRQHWQSVYEYPNANMYHPDEKSSLNRFISDWLVFCRKYGLVSLKNCDLFLVSDSQAIQKP